MQALLAAVDVHCADAPPSLQECVSSHPPLIPSTAAMQLLLYNYPTNAYM